MTILEQIREAELAIIKEWAKARTIFTFMFYAVFLYLILRRINVPPALNTIVSGLFGFWFGQKNTQQNGGVK